MKNVKKLLVLLLASVMVFSLVACGEEEQSGGASDKRKDENAIERSAGLTEEQLSNYVVEFTVTRPVDIAKNGESDNHIQVPEPFYAKEIAFDAYLHSTNADKENILFTARENSCFTYSDQDDYRGWFSAHKQYLGDDTTMQNVTELGEEEVAGYKTKHYQYKSGLFNYHFWVCEDFDLTLKYESVERNDLGGEEVMHALEVTALSFGTVTEADFAACPTPTPAPDENMAIAE